MQSNRKHRGLVKIRSVKDTGSRTNATYLKRAHKSKKRNKGCKNMRKMIYLFEKVRFQTRKRMLMIYRTKPIPTRFAAATLLSGGQDKKTNNLVI